MGSDKERSMAKLHPHVVARLHEVLEFLKETPFASAGDILDGLRRIRPDADGEAILDDDDAASFRRDYEQLVRLLQIEGRKTPSASGTQPDNTVLFAKNGAQVTQANGKNYGDIYSRSASLQTRQFSTDDPTFLMEMIALLPTVWSETKDSRLGVSHLISMLAHANRISAPSARLLESAAAYDSLAIGTPRHRFPGEEMQRPDDVIVYVIMNMPHIVENGMLPQFVLRSVVPEVGKNGPPFYRTAVAYDDAFRRFGKIDDETARDPSQLIAALEKLAAETAERYPPVRINLSTLFKGYAFLKGVADPEAYWYVIHMRGTFLRSRTLQDLRWSKDIDRPDKLLPALITLLPIIRAETGVEELTLRNCIFALKEGGILFEPNSRYFDPAAAFDLHGHGQLVELSKEDLSTKERLFDLLVHVRPDILGYENASLVYFVNALMLMGVLPEEKRGPYTVQATIYDRAFEIAARLVEESPDEETPWAHVQRLAESAEETLATYGRGLDGVDISVMTIVKYLAIANLLQENVEQHLIAAAAADLTLASKWLADSPAKMGAADDGFVGATPELDRFAKNVRPYVRRAAAQDFYSIFARELTDEDTASPETLIERLDSVRTTLEGYEHEPFTTFVRALMEVGKIDDDANSFLRYAAARDLWGERLNDLTQEELASPERLVAKIIELKQDMPGYENVPTTAFVEALAVLGRIPDDLNAFTSTASLYDTMLPPEGNDSRGGSAPQGAGGGDTPPAAPSSPPATGAGRTAGVTIGSLDETAEAPVAPFFMTAQGRSYGAKVFLGARPLAAPWQPFAAPKTLNPLLSII